MARHGCFATNGGTPKNLCLCSASVGDVGSTDPTSCSTTRASADWIGADSSKWIEEPSAEGNAGFQRVNEIGAAAAAAAAAWPEESAELPHHRWPTDQEVLKDSTVRSSKQHWRSGSTDCFLSKHWQRSCSAVGGVEPSPVNWPEMSTPPGHCSAPD